MNITQPYNNGTTVFNASQATGSTIAACIAVAYDTSNTVKLADSSVSHYLPVIGFTTSAIPNGGSGTIQQDGILSGFTGLTPGAQYYSDPATPGGITTTVPVVTGQQIQVVGLAYSATQLLIDIEQSVKAAATTSPLTVASGSTFPGSPNLYDRFYRTDRGIDYYYNGTVWLSMPLLSFTGYYNHFESAFLPIYATSYMYPRLDYSIFIESVHFYFTGYTTFNSTNYWNVTPVYKDGSAVYHNIAGTTSLWLGGRINDVQYPQIIPVNTTMSSPALSQSNAFIFGLTATNTGSPGAMDIDNHYWFYRLVG